MMNLALQPECVHPSSRKTRCIYAMEEAIHSHRVLQTSMENRFHTDDL